MSSKKWLQLAFAHGSMLMELYLNPVMSNVGGYGVEKLTQGLRQVLGEVLRRIADGVEYGGKA